MHLRSKKQQMIEEDAQSAEQSQATPQFGSSKLPKIIVTENSKNLPELTKNQQTPKIVN